MPTARNPRSSQTNRASRDSAIVRGILLIGGGGLLIYAGTIAAELLPAATSHLSSAARQIERFLRTGLPFWLKLPLAAAAVLMALALARSGWKTLLSLSRRD